MSNLTHFATSTSLAHVWKSSLSTKNTTESPNHGHRRHSRSLLPRHTNKPSRRVNGCPTLVAYTECLWIWPHRVIVLLLLSYLDANGMSHICSSGPVPPRKPGHWHQLTPWHFVSQRLNWGGYYHYHHAPHTNKNIISKEVRFFNWMLCCNSLSTKRLIPIIAPFTALHRFIMTVHYYGLQLAPVTSSSTPMSHWMPSLLSC